MAEIPEDNFGFVNYRPQWIPYKNIATDRRILFSNASGQPLHDIRGVVSRRGWEPNWPVVLCFDTLAIGLNTKSNYLWSIDLWQNYEMEPHLSTSHF